MKEEYNAVVLRNTAPLAQGLTSLSGHQGKVVAVPGDVGLGEAVLGLARRHLRPVPPGERVNCCSGRLLNSHAALQPSQTKC